jgi:hypothetical protein
MKKFIKLMILAIIVLFIFACETDDKDDDSAQIQISNLSANPARVYIYNLGSSSYVVGNVPANGSVVIEVVNGDAGLNVNGGRAIIDFQHEINTETVDYVSSTYADLNPNTAAFVTIDNVYGCLDIESFSLNADMWVSINNGPTEIIPAWGDLTKFYDPVGISVTKQIDFNGYTVFEGSVSATVIEDNYTRVDIHPDAGCIWINNTSSSFYIEEVYLSPSYEGTWGSNDLYSDIYPGEFFTWTCTSEMSWDIKVVDDWGDEFTFFDVFLATDQVFVYDYTGFPAAANPAADSEKFENSRNHQIIEALPRCEANEIAGVSPNLNR